MFYPAMAPIRSKTPGFTSKDVSDSPGAPSVVLRPMPSMTWHGLLFVELLVYQLPAAGLDDVRLLGVVILLAISDQLAVATGNKFQLHDYGASGSASASAPVFG